MKPNRSVPSAAVIPVLVYPDVRDAVAWLSAAFGFVERLRIGESHRSQLSFGGGAVIVADVRDERRPPRPDEVTHSVLVRVDDVENHCAHARTHGARILMEPTDFEYGERQYTAEDPGGHRWTFSETLADVAPDAWGGTLVTPEPWPDSLDALVAAPETHRLLFENDALRMLDTRIAPGEKTQLHTHRWPGVLYVLSAAHFVRRDGEGTILVDTREAGTPEAGAAFWVGALPPHTLENVDTTEVRVINVELKRG